jgi:hypothetical protein
LHITIFSNFVCFDAGANPATSLNRKSILGINKNNGVEESAVRGSFLAGKLPVALYDYFGLKPF